jgi:molybdenum cofactor biosynthesis protein B
VSQTEHKAAAPRQVGCFVLTVSDTRTEATDTGGRVVADLLAGAQHLVVGRAIVPDDPERVTSVVREQVANPSVQVVVTTGGTGISSRDNTYEAIDAILDKRLDGFGELFRMLSFQEIGPAAMLSRATAGTCAGKVVIALPGSEAAVRMAMTKLVIPELGHLVHHASR